MLVLAKNSVDEALGNLRPEGVPFQQSVPTALQTRCHFLPGDLDGFDQPLQFEVTGRRVFLTVQGAMAELGVESFQEFATPRQVFRERIQPFLIPARQDFLVTAEDEGHVDLNISALADAVEPPYALLQKGGIQGQVEQDQVVGELEVAAFAADLGTDQQACSAFIREPRCAAVPLDQRQPFVKHRQLHRDALLQRRRDGLSLALGVADQEHFPLSQGLQELSEPIDPRILREVRGKIHASARIRQPFLSQHLELARLLDNQGMQSRQTFGEPSHRGAGVPEHHPTRTVLVEQRVKPSLPGGIISLADRFQLGQHGRFGFSQDAGQPRHLACGKA